MLEVSEREKNRKLLQFLSRREKEQITSEISIQRWLQQEQFINSITRRKLARALDLDKSVLENFLMHGVPDWEEFVLCLPPVPDEYKHSSSQVSINIDNSLDFFEIINTLMNYLSLDWLIKLREEVSNSIERELSRTAFKRQFVSHPLKLLIIEVIARSGVNKEQFIENIVVEQQERLSKSTLCAIISGERLPTRQELKCLALYLKDESDEHYSLEFLLNLLGERLDERRDCLITDSDDIDAEQENCNGINKGRRG